MSAQRRAIRSTPGAEHGRGEKRCRRRAAQVAASAGAWAPLARQVCEAAVGTAPPEDRARSRSSDTEVSPGAPGRVATTSLPSDRLKGWPIRNVLLNALHGSPSLMPSRVHAGRPEPRRLSPPPPLLPSRPHLTLPQFPAGLCPRAERYDGKRDLHFIHAA
jgi:hypothetical protein